MRKILVGFLMDGKTGGIDGYLMNFAKAVCGDQIQIDFLTSHSTPELEKRVAAFNGKVYEIANLWHPFAQYQEITSYIRQEKYDVVYLNVSTAIDCVTAYAAYRNHVEKVILHSHSSGNNCAKPIKRYIYNTIHMICRCFLYKWGTDYLACSKKAGLWLYPTKVVCSDKFKVIYNAVDQKRYRYREDVRRQKRNEFGFGDGTLVLGYVGGFCYQKNNFFLVDVFREIVAFRPNTKLMLVGQGEDFIAVREQVRKEGLADKVLMLGQRDDAEECMQAMDVFVLPSRFEGMPLVSVEAQFSGLPCVLSSRIAQEANISDRCHFLSLHMSRKKWAHFIVKEATKYSRESLRLRPIAKKYCLSQQQLQFEEIIHV